jgi:hypothetical protein
MFMLKIALRAFGLRAVRIAEAKAVASVPATIRQAEGALGDGNAENEGKTGVTSLLARFHRCDPRRQGRAGPPESRGTWRKILR